MTRLDHKKQSDKWRHRYMDLARTIAMWSKHPDWKVGAVAVGSHGQILSTGYNGWPRGICSEEEGHARGKKPSLTIHAETNVIYNASLTGIPLAGSTLYVFPMYPCVECAKAIVQVHISQICVQQLNLEGSIDIQTGRVWYESWNQASQLFREAGVAVVLING